MRIIGGENVIYPRKFMGISDLVELTGLSKDYFKSIAKSKEAPIVRTTGGGKIYFKTDELDAYMQKVTEARNNQRR
jgi:predicted DNA-binding transcriptional regulator AlpA